MKKLILLFFAFCPSLFAYSQSQNALDFDGIDDEVIVPGASALISGSNELSITCWVYPTNANPMYPDFDGFIGFRNESDCDFYVMQVSPATAIEARLRNSSGFDFTITYPGLTLNTWQHLAVTFDGTMLRLYINGIYSDSVVASGAITNTNEAFHIGGLPYSTNPYMLTGKLDEISLFNRALTGPEISCISQESVDANDPGCMLFYTCNQGIANGANTSISSLHDDSGHIDGGLSNFALISTFSNFVGGVNNASSFATTICHGDFYQFGNQILTDPGYYYTTVPQNGGCGNLQELNLIVFTVDSSVTLAGETLTANAPLGFYQWADCNNGYAVIPGENNQSFTPTTDGSYALIITEGTCSDTSACFTLTNVGISENNFANRVSFSPNPFIDKLEIKNLNGESLPELRISDALGKIVTIFPANASANISLDASEWMNGIYFIEVIQGNRIQHYKMVRQ